MPNKYSRQRAISSLHPKIRIPVSNILRKLHSEGLNFEVFEAWRTPDLQQQYYLKGRNAAGDITNRSAVITYARPWQSFHQYGLAVDLVLKNGSKWSWDDTGTNAKKWERMHAIAREHGMTPLSFEKPHIQIASVISASDLYAGNYPEGGDRKWSAKLSKEIAEWNKKPPSPPAPSNTIERPPLTERETEFDRAEQAFSKIMEFIFEMEGGFVNHPHDPGGPTNMGITMATLNHWRKRPVTIIDVENLTREEASEIYERNYYGKLSVKEMPASIALLVMNAAVLSGPRRSAKLLQRALNKTGVPVETDGVIGPQTLRAVRAAREEQLLYAHHVTYLSYLRQLEHWPVFGKGWRHRLDMALRTALDMSSNMPIDETLGVSIYLFRGLLGRVFSTGIDRLAKKLRTTGANTVVVPWYRHSEIKRQIIDSHRSDPRRPVALIGHSFGANTVLRMAKSLNKRGIQVDYVATIDPTNIAAFNTAKSADNFRSRDLRARLVKGATEYQRRDLNHIQIDKDPDVHSQIIDACTNLTPPPPNKESTQTMSDTDPSRSSDNFDTPTDTNTDDPVSELVSIVADALNKRRQSNAVINPELKQELRSVIELLTTADGMSNNQHPMTPANSIFGKGAIGQFLNGKKTAIGIIGLMAVQIFPALFPEAGPLLAALRTIGMDAATADPEAGINILTALFAGFATWGGIGKLEKWAYLNTTNNPTKKLSEMH